MKTIPWACPRASACRALFSGAVLTIAAPAGPITLAFDGTACAASLVDGATTQIEADLFEVISAVFVVLYCAAGGSVEYTYHFTPHGPQRTAHYGGDAFAKRAADHTLWRSIAAVRLGWLPVPLAEEELQARSGAVARAADALGDARSAMRAEWNSATKKAADAADVALAERLGEFAVAQSYQDYVTNVLAAVERGDRSDEPPPTARLPSDRPEGSPW